MSDFGGEGLAVIELSPHAIGRYQERIKPALSLEQAERELVLVLDHASVTHERPSWYSVEGEPSRYQAPVDAFLMLGQDISFPLRITSQGHYAAITCVARSVLSPEARARANEQARRRRRRAVHRGSSRDARHRASHAKRRGEPRHGESEGWAQGAATGGPAW